MVEEDPNELPPEFVPSENDVICGWARQNYHHAGNRMLRDLIQEYVPKYMKASTKTEKGHVIIDIVERIRRDSPTGVGLVRQNKKTGRWFYIGLEKAKDKIGHALRKASLEKSRGQSKEKKTPRKQRTPSTDSLTTASTSPSPTPISSVSLPSSPSQNHQGKYEEGAPVPYYPSYDESYHRAYQHYHYSAYHHHYAASQDGTHDNSAHRGYDVYYPYVSAHAYAPVDYSYSAEATPHRHHHHHQHPHHHAHNTPRRPSGHSQLPGSGESNLYSPVIHSPVISEH